MKYIYVIFKTIRQYVENFNKWLSWKNFGYLLLSIICLLFVVYFSFLLYGYLFLDKKQGACYLESYTSVVQVKKTIDWDSDPIIASCVINDLDCLEEVLNSSICE